MIVWFEGHNINIIHKRKLFYVLYLCLLRQKKKGSYSFGNFYFEYEPFYIGKGVNKNMDYNYRLF